MPYHTRNSLYVSKVRCYAISGQSLWRRNELLRSVACCAECAPHTYNLEDSFCVPQGHSAVGCGLRAATGPRRGGAKQFIASRYPEMTATRVGQKQFISSP